MWYFFRQAEQFSPNDSALKAEVAFRDQRLSGMIEKRLDEKTGAVMLFAGGTPAGAYLLEEEACKPIPFAEFSVLKTKTDQAHRALKLPNHAMRMVWLSLESQVQEIFTLQLEEAWKSQLKAWQDEKWSGLVEVRSEAYHGFALLCNGIAQAPDIFFSDAQGFQSDFPHSTECRDLPRKVVTFKLSSSTQAYQCVLLRQGATHWINRALMRYQELVGQKLLRSLERELNRQIQPWAWNIDICNGNMSDAHFFLHTDYAAHAYRAILMSIGGQMNFVIGNNLTQKVLAETFATVPAQQSAMLQAHRLIPAAFSE